VFYTENKSRRPAPDPGDLGVQMGSEHGSTRSLEIQAAVPTRTGDHHRPRQRDRLLHAQTVPSRGRLDMWARARQSRCDGFQRDLSVAAHTCELACGGVAINPEFADSDSAEHLFSPVLYRLKILGSSELEPDTRPMPPTRGQTGFQPHLAESNFVIEVKRLGEQGQVQTMAAEGRVDHEELVDSDRTRKQQAALDEAQDVCLAVDKSLDQDRSALVARGPTFASHWIQGRPWKRERVPDLAEGPVVRRFTNVDVTAERVDAPEDLFTQRISTSASGLDLGVNRCPRRARSAAPTPHRRDFQAPLGPNRRRQKEDL
jgi:hypothetical protein